MKWSEQNWLAIAPRYQSIKEMSFINELAEGSLPREKFAYYIIQDALYLKDFARTLSLIAARLSCPQDALVYMQFAANALVVENALHESYFREWGIDPGKPYTQEPTCHHYTHFLKSVAALEEVEVAMAAALPCFWIYKEIGEHILQAHQKKDNPYQKWIATYGTAEFAAVTQQAIQLCDKMASKATDTTREKMTTAFAIAAQLEYDFWQAAYELTTWNE